MITNVNALLHSSISYSFLVHTNSPSKLEVALPRETREPEGVSGGVCWTEFLIQVYPSDDDVREQEKNN